MSPWWRQQAQNESKPTRQRLLLLFLFFTCSICIAPYFLWAAFEEISAGKTRGGSLRSCRGPCVHFICCQRRLDLETLAHEASREGRPICPVGSCLSGFRAAQTSRRDPKKDRAPPPARREPLSIPLRFPTIQLSKSSEEPHSPAIGSPSPPLASSADRPRPHSLRGKARRQPATARSPPEEWRDGPPKSRFLHPKRHSLLGVPSSGRGIRRPQNILSCTSMGVHISPQGIFRDCRGMLHSPRCPLLSPIGATVLSG